MINFRLFFEFEEFLSGDSDSENPDDCPNQVPPTPKPAAVERNSSTTHIQQEMPSIALPVPVPPPPPSVADDIAKKNEVTAPTIEDISSSNYFTGVVHISASDVEEAEERVEFAQADEPEPGETNPPPPPLAYVLAPTECEQPANSDSVSLPMDVSTDQPAPDVDNQSAPVDLPSPSVQQPTTPTPNSDNSNNNNNNNENAKLLKCHRCDYTSKWKSNLTRHLLKHDFEQKMRKRAKYRVSLATTGISDTNNNSNSPPAAQEALPSPPSSSSSSSLLPPPPPPTTIAAVTLPVSEQQLAAETTATTTTMPTTPVASSTAAATLGVTTRSDGKQVEKRWSSLAGCKLKFGADAAKKFKCRLCSYRTKWKSNIKQHMQRHHPFADLSMANQSHDELSTTTASCVDSGDSGSQNATADQIEIKVESDELNTSTKAYCNGALSGTFSFLLLLLFNVYNQWHPFCNVVLLFIAEEFDSSAHKKFKCKSCFYRSNHRSSLLSHLVKVHDVKEPLADQIEVLTPEVAAASIVTYERMHGITMNNQCNSHSNLAIYI